MTTRGIRNNNPGNIEKGIAWDGLAKPSEMSSEQRAEPRFCVFRNAVWGIRAMAKILNTYQTRYGLKTILEMVNRWAPDHENPTQVYAKFVADGLGVRIDEEIELNFDNLRYIIRRMIKFENGHQPYTWEVEAGVFAAGIEPRS